MMHGECGDKERTRLLPLLACVYNTHGLVSFSILLIETVLSFGETSGTFPNLTRG